MTRSLLACSVLAVCAALSGSVVTAGQTAAVAKPAPAAAARPNILFILADDMGYGDLSLTGNTKVATPNIDRLARDGLVMTQFYDAAPICSASRAGFLTGQFPARNGFVTFIADRQHNARLGQVDWLDPKVQTLPRALHSAGYATGHFGKWHMGGGRDVRDAPLPTRYGFDESYTQFEGLGPRGLPRDLPSNLAKQSAALGHGPIEWLERADVTSRYVDKTLDFVARHKGKPWFAQMWLDDVHSPWIPDAEQETATAAAGDTEREKKFLAVLVAMDRQIGRLTDALRASGQLDNTLIVFTSDNGPTAGANSPGSAGPYRGRKGQMYEGGIRQALIVRWPGQIPAGKRDATTVAQGIDLYPTLAEIAGAAAPPAPDGVSLVPAWRGTPIATRPDIYSYISRPPANRAAGPAAMLRSGRWKLLGNPDGSGIELYDIAADPAEKRNLAAKMPDVVGPLAAKLAAWFNATRVGRPSEAGAP